MNGYVGRDKLWNDHIWSEIDKVVGEEVGRIRVAQKVFPSTVVNNVLPVVANTVPPLVVGGTPPVPAVLRTGDDQFKPFIELSREFVLTQAQVDGEENMQQASALAKLAASEIAGAEDELLFLGDSSIVAHSSPPFIGRGVTVTNRTAIQQGFVAEAAANGPPINSSGSHVTSVGDIIGAIARGMAALNQKGHPGPYALFLSPNRYAQTFAPTKPGQLQTPGDQINHVVTGGFYMVNSLSDDTGTLVSLGGEPAKIILGSDAMTALTYTGQQGDYHFRVFERIQLVVREGLAFKSIEFSKDPAPPDEAPVPKHKQRHGDLVGES